MSRTDDVVPAVTVVMPVYNGERFLREQVDSILAQDYPALRLTVIDDASTDGSFAILSEYAASDPRVTVTRSETNRGLVPTIGRLLGTVDTPYVALADQDDIWDHDKLTRSVERLVESGASLVYSDVRVCDAEGRPVDGSYLRSRGIRMIAGSDPLPFVYRNPAVGHTIVATGEIAALSKEPPGSLTYHEPWLVAAACSRAGVTYVDDQLGSYRIHDANVVGPSERSFVGRAVRTVSKDGHFAKRQGNREAAVVAIADVLPDLAPMADAYRARGLRRLRHVPRFAAVMRRRVGVMGLKPVSAEILFFLATCFLPGRRAPDPGGGA